jgi:hypothetical protein
MLEDEDKKVQDAKNEEDFRQIRSLSVKSPEFETWQKAANEEYARNSNLYQAAVSYIDIMPQRRDTMLWYLSKHLAYLESEG